MKCNIALWDRIVRFLLGVLWLAWAIAGGPFWAWAGLYFLFTAGWGFCPAYYGLGIRTLREHKRSP
ncbi:MAG: DUF2892 domain-containing protein [Bdellovibrionaceae bacterium]|nr:DUF2892 domain-containing protein [Pseudobdellovibrionaceae bacterium]